MFEKIVVDEIEFQIDPETNFWGIGNNDKLHTLYENMKKKIIADMNELRYNSDMILFYVNPTDRCNANCPYCYLPKEIKSRGKNMSLQELRKITKKAISFFKIKNKKGSIIFHGTEPLLNKDSIFQLVKEFGNEVHFGLQTNGLLLTETDAKFIKEHEVNIGVSLDSPIEEINDALRGEGHHKQIMRILDWFNGYRGLNVVTTITTKNVSHLQALVRFLHNKQVGLCLMNPVRGTQKEALELRPDPSKLASEFIKAVDEAIKLTKEGRKIVVADFANILLGIVAPSARVLMCDISPCGGGRRFFAIDANGNTYPCGEFIGKEEFMGGNIFKDSIEQIILSKNFRKVTQRVVENIAECKTCLFRNICGDPCPAEIYSTDKTMLSKSYYCDFYKQMALHAFKVIARNDIENVIRKSALTELYSI